jgi:hypothetical protein
LGPLAYNRYPLEPRLVAGGIQTSFPIFLFSFGHGREL